ncbi:LOW QUALITY PROTEIN: hypothetical protein U9M48_018579 [Paspalum notatum var. saurae]|uniref:DDE Tnp4 domain-containing protein n=1 Tax=Paspalum notatum var. saurae TaxID=547442 RepID=A0AAQ3TB75_PASNO
MVVGKFYLADAGYAARPRIPPPYRGVRYHLQEFIGPHEPKCPKELFNHRHSSLRTTVERAFGTLKHQFKILNNKPFIPFKSQVKVAIACYAVHNWILDNGPDELVLDEATWYSQLPRSANRVSDYDGDVREWALKRDLIAQQMWNDRVGVMTKLQDVLKTEEGVSRNKYAWSDEETKFMFEWYIGVQKDKPTTFSWKQSYHLQCADALNERHFKACKERWSWIASARAKSGYGFDATTHKFIIDPSEKDPKKLGFFNLLEKLFLNSSLADGSLALDQSTVNVPSDSDESEGVKELENYQMTGDDGGVDSDTIPRHSPSFFVRKRVPSKNAWKGKRCRGNMNDEVSSSIMRLCDALMCANPAATVQNNVIREEPSDPNASLWKRIDDLREQMIAITK